MVQSPVIMRTVSGLVKAGRVRVNVVYVKVLENFIEYHILTILSMVFKGKIKPFADV